ncbi:hypothetical protein M408DRAFT_25955 [Serendipita vermifera MAFF 305830]|uniref:Uncharacterized protein n=1 Tax=Serendipita vermifera MAFF 305830 TaxID=933852 RepID=A0A0C2X9E2_SERVB|nr:hypothetical protein M408DRAFT_334280 [Serendipita vermifera MAFF 305830]KIM25842.1 hypothetical protein M408DRAFT_25955 [Serendipita vermifera MAFF 305830]
MAHFIEIASPSAVSPPPLTPPSIEVEEEEYLLRYPREEPTKIGPQPILMSSHQKRKRSKSDPSFDSISGNFLERQESLGKKQFLTSEMMPIPEMGTPALTYLATPSSTFSHDTPLLKSPSIQERGSFAYRTLSPTLPIADCVAHHGAGSLEAVPAPQSVEYPNSLGLFNLSEPDGIAGDELNPPGHTPSEDNEAGSVMSREDVEDQFDLMWKSRRPTDSRVFFQAPAPCLLNGSVCPLCDNDTLVGSYQCATTMKPFPQAAINRLLKRPQREKMTMSQKRMTNSHVRTGSSYPLSGTLPYLHPITTLEAGLLCATEGCTMKEFKTIDRGAFSLPLKEENYRSIFQSWLFTADQSEELSYDDLFDEPNTF